MTKRHRCPKCSKEYTHDGCMCGSSARRAVLCAPCLRDESGKDLNECSFRGEEFVDEFNEYCRKVLSE